jgi:hypothetical protein
MSRRRTLNGGLALAAAAVLLVAIAPATRGAGAGFPDITLTSQGKSVAATKGSGCWTDPGTGLSSCADAAYPLPVRCTLPVKRGAKLRVRISQAPLKVKASLVDPDGDPGRALRAWKGGATNVSGSDTWRFTIPKAAQGAAAIEVFARFEEGDLDTWTGLKTRSCRESGLAKP